ncbi:MAG: SDR family oxidoreductase [Burkholderiales bacterium]|nr:SDR family oxidoreductase [Phycisphaerae bacterium]
MTNPKTAIITGAGRGIGRATAIQLSAGGASCVLIARSNNELAETASLCAGETLVISCDVRDPARIGAAVEQAIARFGRIDVLVNNAGYAPLLPFDQTTPTIWDDVIAINLSAVYHFCRAVWPGMVARKSGVIVNVSSEASRDPFPGFSAYATAKAAVNMFTRSLAKEGDAHGIRLHAIAPAGVETSMLRAIASEQVLPRDHTLDPADVAAAICACVTGDLRHASGETIFIHRRTGP